MRRPVKFRAWDGDDNEMYYPQVLAIGMDKKLLPLRSCKDGNRAYKDHDLMQFTGLKDRNGKEIYESDIILIKEKHANFPLKWIVVYNDEQMGFRLRWGQRFTRGETGFYDILPTQSNYEQFEIIGNIHQNPELLKP